MCHGTRRVPVSRRPSLLGPILTATEMVRSSSPGGLHRPQLGPWRLRSRGTAHEWPLSLRRRSGHDQMSSCCICEVFGRATFRKRARSGLAAVQRDGTSPDGINVCIRTRHAQSSLVRRMAAPPPVDLRPAVGARPMSGGRSPASAAPGWRSWHQARREQVPPCSDRPSRRQGRAWRWSCARQGSP